MLTTSATHHAHTSVFHTHIFKLTLISHPMLSSYPHQPTPLAETSPTSPIPYQHLNDHILNPSYARHFLSLHLHIPISPFKASCFSRHLFSIHTACTNSFFLTSRAHYTYILPTSLNHFLFLISTLHVHNHHPFHSSLLVTYVSRA